MAPDILYNKSLNHNLYQQQTTRNMIKVTPEIRLHKTEIKLYVTISPEYTTQNTQELFDDSPTHHTYLVA